MLVGQLRSVAWRVPASTVQHIKPFDDVPGVILLRSGQRSFAVVLDDSHPRVEAEVVHALHGEAVLE